jgi:hypothetical protein
LVVVEFAGKTFLVDPTFRQFFHPEQKNNPKTESGRTAAEMDALARQGIDARPVVDHILREGCIELTPENARIYGQLLLHDEHVTPETFKQESNLVRFDEAGRASINDSAVQIEPPQGLVEHLPAVERQAPAANPQAAGVREVINAAIARIPASPHRDQAALQIRSLAASEAFRALPEHIQTGIADALAQHTEPTARAHLLRIATDPAFAALTHEEQAQLLTLLRGHDFHVSAHARRFLAQQLEGNAARPPDERVAALREAIRDQAWLSVVMIPQPGIPVARVAHAPPRQVWAGSVAFEGRVSAPGKVYEVEIQGHKIQVSVADNAPAGLHAATLEQVTASLAHMSPAELALIRHVRVNPDRNSADAAWAREYNDPSFRSAATAGSDGTVDIYPWENGVDQRQLDTTLVHEVGHVLSKRKLGEHVTDPGWQMWSAAIAGDASAASKYARKNAEEDFSETLALYKQVKGTPFESSARALMPGRFAILDVLTAVHDPVPAHMDGFAPVTTLAEYEVLSAAQQQLQGNDVAAHAWLKSYREATAAVAAARSAQPADAARVQAAETQLRHVQALRSLQPPQRAVQAVILAAGFGLQIMPHFGRVSDPQVTAKMLAAADPLRTVKDPAVRARFDDAMITALYAAAPHVTPMEMRSMSRSIAVMEPATYAAWRERLAAASPEQRTRLLFEAVETVRTWEDELQGAPTVRPPSPSPNISVITERTRHHVHHGEIQTQGPYAGKWSDKGAHTWPAIQEIIRRDGFTLESVFEDPVTHARRVMVRRTAVDQKTGATVSTVKAKHLYPKRFTAEEVDAAGAAALEAAMANAPGSSLIAPGTPSALNPRGKQRNGKPVDGSFEATISAGNPAVTIKVQGWYVIGADGKPEITSHVPAAGADWPAVKKEDY